MTRNYLLGLLFRHDIVMVDGDINLTVEPQVTHLVTVLDYNQESSDKLCNLSYKGNILIMKLEIKEASAQLGRITDGNSNERRKSLG